MRRHVSGLGRRFSVGLTLGWTTAADVRRIFDEFAEFIADVYFSPPFGERFHTRRAVAESLPPSVEAERRVFGILEDAARRGIGLNLALNTHMVRPEGAVAAAVRGLLK